MVLTREAGGDFLRRMRTLWMVVVVLLVGGSACRRRVPKQSQLYVPNTPEGNECKRQCMVVRASCAGGRGVNERICRERERECLATCPGASFDGASDPDMPTR